MTVVGRCFSATKEKLLYQLNTFGVACLMGVYGSTQNLVAASLAEDLEADNSVTVLDCADIAPSSTAEVYSLILATLGIQQPTILTDFTFHYAVTTWIANQKLRQIILIKAAHNLLNLPDVFWDNWESIRHQSNGALGIMLVGEPQLLFKPTAGVNRLQKSPPVMTPRLSSKLATDLIFKYSQKRVVNLQTHANTIIRLADGHLGTLRWLCSKLGSHPPIVHLSSLQVRQWALEDPQIDLWISTVLRSLNERHIQYISRLLVPKEAFTTLSSRKSDATTLDELISLNLVQKYGDTVSVRLPTFADQLLNIIQTHVHDHPAIELMNNGQTIKIRGVDVTKMFSNSEREILTSLISKSPDSVNIDELSTIIWGKEEDKFSLWAISKAISRIRKKLSQLGLPKNLISYTRGKGYTLQKN